jgi:hypothetical protein
LPMDADQMAVVSERISALSGFESVRGG